MTESSASPENPAELLNALEQELAAAHRELEDYQRLIDEIPALYEVKFRYRVQDVAQDIRRLMEERQGLQDLLCRSIQGQAIGTPPASSSNDSPRRWALVALLRARRRLRRLPRWQLVLAAGAGALALAVPVGLSRSANPARQAAEAPAAATHRLPEAPPQLRLRATGEVWLELRSLNNQPVLEATLRPGQETFVPLGEGLRLRSGRPHLLQVAVADQPLAPLAPANDFAWRTFLAPKAGQNPGLKPKVEDKSS